MAIQRGEIYFVDLDPVQGREQAGRRPVLVLSVDAINQLPLVVALLAKHQAAQELSARTGRAKRPVRRKTGS